MPRIVMAFCNFLLGALLAVVATLIAPLFLTRYWQFGLLLCLLVVGFLAVMFLLEWFDIRLGNALARGIGLPKAAPTAHEKSKFRPVYWGVLGFCVGLAACAIWTPAAVLGVFRPLIN